MEHFSVASFYFNGHWRLDWGFGNPNKTAALIATLMVATWIFSYLKRSRYYVSLAVCTALGVCLIFTFSRGGILAAAVGLLCLAINVRQPISRQKLLITLTCVAMILSVGIYLQVYHRFQQGLSGSDASVLNRLIIWSNWPRMMYDSPTGWGLHNAVQAYSNWYQPLDQSERYRTLVNSHLMWLVELGWPFRFVYIFLWLTIFSICIPSKHARWFSVPLGIWAAFATASLFSAVAESATLWILPLVSLASVVHHRFRRHIPIPSLTWTAVFSVSILCCFTFFYFGYNDRRISGSSTNIIVGKNPHTWITTDSDSLGEFPGKALRRYLIENNTPHLSLGLSKSVNSIPIHNITHLVISGFINDTDISQLNKLLNKNIKVTFIAPKMSPHKIALHQTDPNKVTVVFGEISQSSLIPSWESQAKVIRIPGNGDFIPDWPREIFLESTPH